MISKYDGTLTFRHQFGPHKRIDPDKLQVDVLPVERHPIITLALENLHRVLHVLLDGVLWGRATLTDKTMLHAAQFQHARLFERPQRERQCEVRVTRFGRPD